MSPKKWSKSMFRLARAVILLALVNAGLHVAFLCFSIFIEALKRSYKPEEIHNSVCTIGLLVNIVGLFLFYGLYKRKLPTLLSDGDINDNKSNFQLPVLCAPQTVAAAVKEPKKESSASQMNRHGVFLRVLPVASRFVIVIIGALLGWLTDWQYRNNADPALSLTLVVLIVHSTLPSLIDSAMTLLQTVPTHTQIDYLQNKPLHEIKSDNRVAFPVSTNCTSQTCCGSMKDVKSDSKHHNISPSENGLVDR